MAKKVKGRKSTPAQTDSSAGQGRVAQKNRTRRAIVEAAIRLLAGGRVPSMADVTEAAQVSRRTIYMYFPTWEQLLLDATLGALSADAKDPLASALGCDDAVACVEQLSRAVNALSGETMHLGRALIRLTVEAEEPRGGAPRRGYRRIEWIERALEPVRSRLASEDFERLVSALSVLMGWEALILLKDVRGVGQREAEDVLAFAARAVVEVTLHTSAPAKRQIRPVNH